LPLLLRTVVSVLLRDGRRFPNALKEKHVSMSQLLAIVYLSVTQSRIFLQYYVMSLWLLLTAVVRSCAVLPAA
jgi:hypothetical protein